MYITDSVQNEMILSRFHSMQIQPNILMYCSQLYTTLNFVRKGDCAAFLYSSLAANPRDFVQIPLDPRLSTDFGTYGKKTLSRPFVLPNLLILLPVTTSHLICNAVNFQSLFPAKCMIPNQMREPKLQCHAKENNDIADQAGKDRSKIT